MLKKILVLSMLLILILLTLSCSGMYLRKQIKAEKPPVVMPPSKVSGNTQVILNWFNQNKKYLNQAFAANRIIYYKAGSDAGTYSKTFGKNDKVRLPNTPGFTALPILSKDYKTLYLLFYDNNEQKHFLLSVSKEHGAKFIYTFDRTPFYYDVSPNEQELAFSTKEGDIYQIYRANLRTKELSRFTDSSIGGVFPNYRPSGKCIAYCAQRKLRIKEIDTGKERILVDDLLLKEIPKWSPDGNWIVYQASAGGDVSYDIYKVNVSTGKIDQLTTQPGLDANPSFDHTGQYIIFMSAINNTQGNQKLAIMDADGNNVRIDSTSDIDIYFPVQY